MSLVLRNEKGSQLTFNEMDGNFTYLEELSQTGSFTGSFTGDGSGLTGIPGVTPIDTGSFVSTASFNEYTASVTESVVTAIVTNVASNYYEIDGIQAPKLSFVPGITYRFDLSGIEGNHPFKFSISPNGPTEYTTGVTSGSNFIQIQVGYDTTTSLYYYCTNHNGMGNEINVLGIDKLVTTASFNEFTSSYNSGSFSGSFVGDGSGLTGIPGVTPIATGSFATTGSNTFVGNQIVTGSLTVSGSITHRGNQTITGSLNVSGSITAPGSGSYRDFINDRTKFRSIRGNGPGLFNIIEQGDTGITFAVSKITTNDLTSAITSNLSGANNGDYSDAQPTTSGVGRGARLMFTIAGGVVTSVRIFDVANGNNSYEEYGQPANRQGIGYKAGDTLTVAAGTGGIGGTGNLVITLRPQDIETYLGHDSRLTFDYDDTRTLRVEGDIVTTTNLTIGEDDDTSEFYVSNNGSNSIVAGVGVTAGSDTGGSIVTGYYNTTNYQGTAVFGAWNTASEGLQTVIGLASNTAGIGAGAFIIGNGTDASTKSNLLVAQGSTVQVTGSLLVTGSANIRGGVTGSSFTGSFVGDGSGLTGIPGVTPIATGSFATTGSNIFVGNQVVSGSVTISGSISQVGVGESNTIIGFEAGKSRTTGTFNTLIGRDAGERVTTANNNTFIGASSGQATTTGDYNIALGSSALFSNTTGTSNTAIGYLALSQLVSGNSSNIAIGYGAGTLTADTSNLSSSADSIFIGDATYAQNNSQTNQIVIGMYAVGAGSNTTMIGNDNTTATYLKGTLNVTRQILSEVSSSLNFVDDTAAASGGVPLGGLYRNGNVIQIRLV